VFGEATALKRALTYFAGGIVLGLMIVLVPLITLTEFNVDNRISQQTYSQSKSLSDEFRGIEGSYGSGTSGVLITDFVPLAIGFVVAMVAYLAVRWKRSS
jgi:hypothetical protein